MLVAADKGLGAGAATARAVLAGKACAPPVNEWQDLAANASETNAFLEPWFAKAAIAHLREGSDVWQIEVRTDTLLTGLMHLSLHKGYGRIPVNYLGNWTHYQCFMGTPLIRAGHETGFWEAVLALLDSADWAPNFLSLSGIEAHGPVHQGLVRSGRACAIVHRHERALLRSELDGEAYLEASLRGKKRKELRRLANRLSEMGTVAFRVFDGEGLEDWCEAFLSLEASGWKGAEGAALGNTKETRAFFAEMMAGAQTAGRLDFQRLDLDGRAIAMLINFRTPPGSWSFKIAFDEELSRFSPGVMIELENLKRVLADPDVDWMDSCAAEGHPMIDKLWMERREIVQLTVPLAGAKRRIVHQLCRAAEIGSQQIKRLKR
jgi:CelD/BcsL family acetyltransferase involved in cellulose biosynthesis